MNSVSQHRAAIGAVINFLILAIPAFALAQSPGTAPSDPILARAPERAEWVIGIRYDRERALEGKEAEPAAAKTPQKTALDARPSTIRITKDGSTYREIVQRLDGIQSEKWIVDGLQLRTGPEGRIVRIMPPATFYAPDFSDYTRSDFEAAEWVTKSNFSGTRQYRGTDVYVFEADNGHRRLTPREKAERAGGNFPEFASNSEKKSSALIDIKTRRPLLVDDGEVVWTYDYRGPSAEALAPPPNFAQALARWKKEIQRKTAVPLPP